MKKWLVYVLSTILVLGFMVQMGWLEVFGIHRFSPEQSYDESAEKQKVHDFYEEDGVSCRIKTEGSYFYVYDNNKWEKTFWKGVNIGAGEPGLFPGELTISYEDYYRWFGYISEMNANCIRVYTILRPQFYNALADFNEQAENPIYLFQGVWMDEEDIATYADVYAENNKIKDEFIKDELSCADVIMGNANLPERSGFASGVYTADVSKWFAGWILGMEFDPKFIMNTNDSNPDNTTYEGKYLYTFGSTPFETFLCEAGDKLIEYTTENYHKQYPIAYTNWVTTDPLIHPEEPHEDEDIVTLNTESIRSRQTYLTGQFASYHVYPYYPDSLNYQKDYLEYIDNDGKINTYKAYLEELKLAHTMPIMVSEFGIPTSRGITHKSIMGYNQGGVDETKQGDMLKDMFESIYDLEYAGGLVFAWQDEWFKRTWNNVKFDVPDSRPLWSNIQTSEQNFGILAFDAGEKASVCKLDGLIDDWALDQPAIENEYGRLYMKCDERYVYFMLEASDKIDFDKDTVLIPIDSIANQGNTRMIDTKVSFDTGADFVISINGKNDSRILVDSYYDVFYYLYGEQYGMIDKVKNIATKNSGRFNQMMMCYGYDMTIPSTKESIPFASYETGKLTYGNGDPESVEYQSLSDYIYNGNNMEIRIPWQLLNVMDPSSKKIMDDFYNVQSISPIDFDGFKVGIGLDEKKSTIKLIGKYNYKEWKMPTYHERLKPSYYVLQKTLKELN